MALKHQGGMTLGRKALVVCLSVGLLSLAGCGWLFPVPGLPPEVVIGEQTKVLDQQSLEVLDNVSEDGTFSFSAPTPLADSLEPGDVIVVGVTDETPFGLLRRVSHVERVESRTTVTTTQARLTDAIDQGRIEVSAALTGEGIVSTTAREGVVVRPSQRDLRYDLTTELAEGIWATGSLEMQISFDFTLDIRWRSVEYVNFETYITQRLDLSVDANTTFSRSYETKIARHYFKPIVIWVGPVPVAIVPVVTIYVGVDGSVHTSFTAGVTQEAELRAGARYRNGWTNVARFEPKFGYQEPVVSSGRINVRGYGKGELGLLIYAVTGPYATITPYLELDADPNAQPWWELHGGLSCYAGVKFDILGYRKDYETGELAGIRRLLASATDSTTALQPGQSIQAAVDAAPEGAVVQLAPGEWTEHVTIEKSLTLRGTGPEETTVRGQLAQAGVLRIRAPKGREIRVHVERMRVDGAGVAGFGVYLFGSVEASITSCTISATTGTGIVLEGREREAVKATISDCVISDNGVFAMWIGPPSQIIVTDCTISDNRHGVYLWGDTAEGTITGCTISGNDEHGIELFASPDLTLWQSAIMENGRYGVVLAYPCFHPEEVYSGRLAGGKNTIPGPGEPGENRGGAFCPPELAFLTTNEGGELNR